MRGRKLNTAGKVVAGILLALILFIIAGTAYVVISKVKDQQVGKDKEETKKEVVKEETMTTESVAQNSATKPEGKNDTIRITIDEWIGWKSLLDANGGLTTKPDSINAKNGIKV